MKNNFSKLAVRVVLFLLVLAAGWYFTKSSKGSAPVVKMGTVEVKVGETKCSAITDAGYKLTGSGYASTLDAKTWSYLITAEKDDKTYAYLTVYNDTGDSKRIEDCTIGEISISDSMIEDEVTVDGNSLKGKSTEEIKEAFKSSKSENESDTEIDYKDGKYETEVEFENGSFLRVRVIYDFGKSFN